VVLLDGPSISKRYGLFELRAKVSSFAVLLVDVEAKAILERIGECEREFRRRCLV
jgi:hypothetical protein